MAFQNYTDNVLEAIKTFLNSRWTDTPIQWPNDDYQADGASEFIRVEIHGTNYGQQSIGAARQADNRWDREGLLWIYVLVPRGVGSTTASGAALAIANLFRGTTLLNGSLEFMDSNIGAGGASAEDGAWFLVPLSVEWRFIDAN